jgi:PAS domain S-box-containing protein
MNEGFEMTSLPAVIAASLESGSWGAVLVASVLSAGAVGLIAGLIWLLRRWRLARHLGRYHSTGALIRILDQLPINVLVKDLDGRLVFCNRRYAAAMHMSVADMIGKRDHDLFPAVMAEKYRLNDRMVIAELRDYHTEEEHFDGQGRRIVVEVFKTPLLDRRKRPIGVLGVFWDVTSRKRNEQDLTYEKELLHALLDWLPAYIYFKDTEGRFKRLSRCLAESFGLKDPREAYGMSDFDFFPPQYAQQAFADEQALLAGKTSRICKEEQPVRADGRKVHVLTHKLPMRDEAGRIVGTFGVSQDITEIKQANEQATAANQSKSRFLANMSHEIRTPMTAILGYADMLLEPGISSQRRNQIVHTIRRNGDHLLRLINDILDISKIEAGRLEVERVALDPRRIIEEVASLMNVRAVEKQIEFHVLFQGRIPESIQGDPTRLRQILVNLTANAIKFTSRGSVRLEARCDLDASTDRARLVVDVVDSGVGIRPDQMERLFKPFSQADASTTRNFGGTGLGLAISKRLAEQLGGDIDVASAVGVGSRFSLRIELGPASALRLVEPLPIDVSQLAVTAPDDASDLPTGAGQRILLAEDGEDNQDLISHYLTTGGYEVDLATNGRVAVDKALHAAESGRPYALIFMDMQMPVLDGYGAASELRQSGYKGLIVALTAHAMAGDREQCLLAGCDDYATKPISRGHILTLVHRLLANPSPSPAAPAASSQALPQAALMEKFIARLGERITAIESAIAQQDLQTLRTIAHQLKGAAKGYGYPQLGQTAAQIEQRLRDGEPFDSVRQQIDQWLGECRSIARAPVGAPTP